MPLIKTKEHITLQKIKEREIPRLFELIQKNPELTKYLLWNIPHSLNELIEKYQILEKEETNGILKRFGIFYNDEIIGVISINNIIHQVGRRVKNVGELGYWLSPLYSGKGLATEAAQKMMEYGFTVLKLHKIKAACVPENIASEKILQKIGMRHIGTSKDHYFEFDRWWNMELYEITKDEWGKSKKYPNERTL